MANIGPAIWLIYALNSKNKLVRKLATALVAFTASTPTINGILMLAFPQAPEEKRLLASVTASLMISAVAFQKRK